jgi:hypothetical protein
VFEVFTVFQMLRNSFPGHKGQPADESGPHVLTTL